MAYDEKLAARVASILSGLEPAVGLETRKMFGGLCFMVNGRMVCGVHNADLIAKFDPERHAALAAKPGARPFDFTGRPARGILYVGPAGIKTAAALKAWVLAGLEQAVSRPPAKKPPKRNAARSRARKA